MPGDLHTPIAPALSESHAYNREPAIVNSITVYLKKPFFNQLSIVSIAKIYNYNSYNFTAMVYKEQIKKEFYMV